MVLTPERKAEILDEAVAVANAVQAVVAGHNATACSIALGWVIGAVASHGRRGESDLNDLTYNVTQQARIKFDGIRNGTWPDGSCEMRRS